jgi:alpha-mannosidase
MYPEKMTVYQGYLESISGEKMLYHSPLPGERSALLTRATDGWKPIVWRTEAPAAGGDSVRFTWIAGLGCNLGSPSFTLHVGGIDEIEFRVIDEADWRASGPAGCSLRFRGLMRDHYGDRFGLMFLDVPASRIVPGEPIKLAIEGSRSGSQAWVMTFEEALGEGVLVAAPPLALRGPGGGTQPIDLTIVQLEDSAQVSIQADGHSVERTIPFGISTVRLEVPAVVEPKHLSVHVEVDGDRIQREVTLEPVPHWTIDLIQHSHTDIGYTRTPAEILAEHLRYIDTALDYCDATDDYPDDARFRWTCEVSWPVREYLRVRPSAQVARLKRRVMEGRIELTAMPLNMGEVADERVLAGSLRWIAGARALGLPVQTAMQNDVNGFAWSMLDPLSEIGVRYVWMGENAHRALKPFDVPTVFRWESPSGRSVVAYRSDHYMTGNFWGILGNDLDRFGTQMLEYLRVLTEKGYPEREIGVQYSGYFTDNSPPSTAANDLVHRWNDRYEWPRLRTSTTSGFLDRCVQQEKELPVIRAAWPDWWTDGFGSAMRETATIRRAQAEQAVNLSLLSLARVQGLELPSDVSARMEAIDDLLLFYDEHTFGAAESVTDPACENSQVQWMEKASYAWQTAMQVRLLRESALGVLDTILPADSIPTLAVYNTLNWPRSELVTVFIDHQILPRDAEAVALDSEGTSTPLQKVSSRAEGSTWALWAENVPAFGVKRFRIRPGSAPSKVAEPATASPEDSTVLENRWYRVAIDAARGGIVSVIDKDLGRDILSTDRAHQMGEAIHEQLDNRSAMEKLTLGGHRRTNWSGLTISRGSNGPIWESTIIDARLEGLDDLRCDVRLFRTSKRIELRYTGRKRAITEPEGLYISFPFDLPGGHIVFEAQGAEVEPGTGQLPGTASDWNTIQSYAAIRGRNGQIVITSHDAPLMQFGGINTGRYAYRGTPASNLIYSWVLNNYWVTNFRASQDGEISWSYSITSDVNPSPVDAARFGWGTRQPLVARVHGATTNRDADSPGKWKDLDLNGEGLFLLCAIPEESGSILLHVRNMNGRPVDLTSWTPPGGLRAVRANAIAHSDPRQNAIARADGTCKSHPLLERGDGDLVIRPFETAFLRLAPHGAPPALPIGR